jgi:hypothetical protein
MRRQWAIWLVAAALCGCAAPSTPTSPARSGPYTSLGVGGGFR